MHKLSLLYILILLCSIFNIVYAQAPKVEHITVEDGLPNSTVKVIYQDKIGFMWFGTRNGLVRYDGNEYEQFIPNHRNSKALPDGYISSLYQAKDGNIYIGTYNGYLCRFNYLNNEIEQLLYLDTVTEKIVPIVKIIETSANEVILATLGEGIIRYDFIKKKCSKIQLIDPNGIKRMFVSDLVVDSSGDIWAAADGNYIYKWIPNLKSLVSFEISLPYERKFVAYGNRLYIDETKIYVGTEYAGCFSMDISSTVLLHIPETQNYHITAIEKIDDNLVLATDGNGLFEYNTTTKAWINLLYSANDINSISTNAIWNLGVSRDKILWIGTFARGIDKISYANQIFKNYRYTGVIGNSISSPSVLGIAQSKDKNILFATDGGGIDIFNPRKNTFDNFNTANSSLKTNVIKSIYEDSDGLMWFGSYAHGISFLDKTAEQKHAKIIETLRDISVWDIVQDKSGVYWFATLYQGLFSYNQSNQTIKHYMPDSKNRFSISHTILYNLFIDSKNRLWIGSDGGGLSLYDSQNDIFINYLFEKKQIKSLGSNEIRCIYEDSKGHLWIGTKNGGLNLLVNEERGEFIQYTKNEGLTSNTICDIIEDSGGILWLSSDNGIMKFNINTKEIETFTIQNGLQGQEFNYQSALKASDGRIYWGGLNGFNIYDDKKNDLHYSEAPNIIIKRIYVNGLAISLNSKFIVKSNKETSFFSCKKLKLDAQQRNVAFDFVSFNFQQNQKLVISYKLEGFQDNWSLLKPNQHYIEFNKLPGGEYILHYKVTDLHTNITKSNSITIYIQKSLWERPLFYVLLFLCFIGILVIIFISIIKIKNRRAIELEEKIEARTKLISKQNEELMLQRDSLRLSNSKIIMQKQELQESHEEMNVQNEELRTKSDLLREVNQEITEQNKLIADQASKLKDKNTLITKSLNYARRIQNTVFPSEDQLHRFLPKSFVFFKAKDIVSGDFYWIRAIDNKIIFAEVDCTGHGVPGAFMSMIGNTLLNEIILNKKILKPDDIFYELNTKLLDIFSLGEFDMEAQDDGMDLTLGVIDIEKNTVMITSAMQNFYIVENDEIHVCKGDIFSIGGLMARYKKPIYTLHQFDLKPGMRIYFSSDGYVDQFGGPNRGKYGVERFENLLRRIKSMDINEQKEALQIDFDAWVGENEQLDDILILGIEF